MPKDRQLLNGFIGHGGRCEYQHQCRALASAWAVPLGSTKPMSLASGGNTFVRAASWRVSTTPCCAISACRAAKSDSTTLPRVAPLAIERRLVPIIPAHRLPTQPTPPMRRPIKGWGGRASCLHRRTGGAEPYMLAQDACIDLRSKAYRVPPVAAGLRDASAAMAESARGRSQARESHWLSSCHTRQSFAYALALTDTDYGRLLLTKIGLFFGTIAIAAISRLHSHPTCAGRECLCRTRCATPTASQRCDRSRHRHCHHMCIVSVLGVTPHGSHHSH